VVVELRQATAMAESLAADVWILVARFLKAAGGDRGFVSSMCYDMFCSDVPHTSLFLPTVRSQLVASCSPVSGFPYASHSLGLLRPYRFGLKGAASMQKDCSNSKCQ